MIRWGGLGIRALRPNPPDFFNEEGYCMQGEVRRLKQVFNSFMEIPIYQRNYDWKIAQCERLFDDLLFAGAEIHI